MSRNSGELLQTLFWLSWAQIVDLAFRPLAASPQEQPGVRAIRRVSHPKVTG